MCPHLVLLETSYSHYFSSPQTDKIHLSNMAISCSHVVAIIRRTIVCNFTSEVLVITSVLLLLCFCDHSSNNHAQHVRTSSVVL